MGTLKIIFLLNLIEVKCMYNVIPFMKSEKNVCTPLRLNRALEQETEREHACLGEMEMSVSGEWTYVFKWKKIGLRKVGQIQVSVTCIARPRAVAFTFEPRN